jgi:uncharacterized protein YceK
MAHIDKDKYMVQAFMSLLKENRMMSVHTMVLKLEACTSVVNRDQASEAGFSSERSIGYEAKWNSKWIR